MNETREKVNGFWNDENESISIYLLFSLINFNEKKQKWKERRTSSIVISEQFKPARRKCCDFWNNPLS